MQANLMHRFACVVIACIFSIDKGRYSCTCIRIMRRFIVNESAWRYASERVFGAPISGTSISVVVILVHELPHQSQSKLG